MERKIVKKIFAWKNNLKRMPLFIYRARQVGKTYCSVKDGNITEQRIIDMRTETGDGKNVDTHYFAVFCEDKGGCMNILMNKKDSNGTGKYDNGWYILDSGMEAKRLDIKAEAGIFIQQKAVLAAMLKVRSILSCGNRI